MFIFQTTKQKKEGFGSKLTTFEEKLDALTDMFPPTAIAKSTPIYVAIESIKKSVKELRGDYKNESTMEEIERKLQDLSDAVNGFNPVYRMTKGTIKTFKNDVNDAVYYYNQYVDSDERAKTDEQPPFNPSGPNVYRTGEEQQKTEKKSWADHKITEGKDLDNTFVQTTYPGGFKTEKEYKDAVKKLKGREKELQAEIDKRKKQMVELTKLSTSNDKTVAAVSMHKILTLQKEVREFEKLLKDVKAQEKKIGKKRVYAPTVEEEAPEKKEPVKLFGDTPMEHMYRFISETPAALDYFDEKVSGEKYSKFLDYFGATEETANEERINDLLSYLASKDDKVQAFKDFLQDNVFAEKFAGGKYTSYSKEGRYYGEEPVKVEDKRKKKEETKKEKEAETEEKEEPEKKETKPDEKETTPEPEEKETTTVPASEVSAYLSELTDDQQTALTEGNADFWNTAKASEVNSFVDQFGAGKKDFVMAYLKEMAQSKVMKLFYQNAENDEERVNGMIGQMKNVAGKMGYEFDENNRITQSPGETEENKAMPLENALGQQQVKDAIAKYPGHEEEIEGTLKNRFQRDVTVDEVIKAIERLAELAGWTNS